MADVQLLRVTATEKQAFMELCLPYNRELNPAFEPSPHWRETYFETAVNNPAAELFWISTDAPAGFVLLGHQEHQFRPGLLIGYIYDFYIKPDSRNSGVAQEGARLAIEHLFQAGCSRIQLEVLHSNERAVRFWDRLGFKSKVARYVLEGEGADGG